MRYLTGYLCGMGLAVLTSGGILSLFRKTDHEKSALDKPYKLSVLLAISGLLGAVFYLAYPFVGVAAPLAALAAQWAGVTLVNLLIISTTRFWNMGVTSKRRILLVCLCIVAAGVEMAIFSFAASMLGYLVPWYVHP